MDIQEYRAKLIEMIDWKMALLEPGLLEHIMAESGPDCHNTTERITHSIFFWSGKDKERRAEVMAMFGINPRGKN